MINRRTFIAAGLAVGAMRKLIPAAAFAADDYTTVSYKSGSLNIAAYIYRPPGDGPFPLIVFNHGSRAKHERKSVPFEYMGDLYRAAGYAVLVPERRGYGESDGTTFSEAAGGESGAVFVDRMEEEADDVLAAADYGATLPFVDPERIGVAGYSFGGIVAILAIARNKVFKVALDQAGGSLSWKKSPDLRKAMTAAIGKVKIPVMFMDAKNDATTDSVTTLAAAMQKAGRPLEIKIYPAFTPTRNPGDIPAGHLIFSDQGVDIWRQDALRFFNKVLQA
jgi:carboxymethylenebutenolidase